jgi:hypothetical protein
MTIENIHSFKLAGYQGRKERGGSIRTRFSIGCYTELRHVSSDAVDRGVGDAPGLRSVLCIQARKVYVKRGLWDLDNRACR